MTDIVFTQFPRTSKWIENNLMVHDPKKVSELVNTFMGQTRFNNVRGECFECLCADIDEYVERIDKAEEEVDKKNSSLNELKTSHEWYLTLPVQRIADPDGWRSLDDPTSYWHSVPISWKEFDDRASQSTMKVMGTDLYPFGKL